MKTSKAKAINKPKKTSEVGETLKNEKVTASKSVPSEEEIRKKAYEIYSQRIDHGKHGTALDDWHTAEEFLKHS
jgi:Txe/YoeB family toxin of Txe-Axe toxin-antitoxin module